MNTDSYLLANQEPMVITDRFRQIHDFAFDGGRKPSVYTNDFFGSDGGDDQYWANAVGKRVLCKAQWLTGLERNVCGAQILAKCGRKPICSGIVSRKCKTRKGDWLKCAQGVSYVPNPNDPTTGAGSKDESLADSGAGVGAGDSGVGTGADVGGDKIFGIDKRYVLYGGLALLLIGGGVAVATHRKNKKAMMQTVPVRR